MTCLGCGICNWGPRSVLAESHLPALWDLLLSDILLHHLSWCPHLANKDIYRKKDAFLCESKIAVWPPVQEVLDLLWLCFFKNAPNPAAFYLSSSNPMTRSSLRPVSHFSRGSCNFKHEIIFFLIIWTRLTYQNKHRTYSTCVTHKCICNLWVPIICETSRCVWAVLATHFSEKVHRFWRHDGIVEILFLLVSTAKSVHSWMIIIFITVMIISTAPHTSCT